MKLTHHGHSCIELETDDAKVLFDPGVFSDFSEVTGCDAVVVTHQHADHLDPEALPQLRENNPEAIWFADPQTATQLAAQGIEATVTRAAETYRVYSLTLEGVGSTHAEIHPYIDRINNVGVVVSAAGEPRVFHPGDSLEGRPENVDYLLTPISAPWCAVKETIAFVRAVQPGHIVPIHDKVVAEHARGIYLSHIRDYGLDGGVEVLDVAQGDSADLSS